MTYQILIPAEGLGKRLEFDDENGDTILSITIDENNRRMVEIYPDDNTLMIPLDLIKDGIAIAEREVVNADPDSLFEGSD